MDSQQVFTLGQQSLYMLLMISAPVLLTVLAVGLIVSVFQAATQIHEATLSFVPKIVAAVAVLAIAGPWMLTSLVEYLPRPRNSIPSMYGRPLSEAARANIHGSPDPAVDHAAPPPVPARARVVRR